jgi:6-phosphogluconolactonase
MPVESSYPAGAAAEYAMTLQKIAGSPPALDLVHLGLEPDGHTASLVSGDPVLQAVDRDIAITGLYQGRKRMMLTIRSSTAPTRFFGWLQEPKR